MYAEIVTVLFHALVGEEMNPIVTFCRKKIKTRVRGRVSTEQLRQRQLRQRRQLFFLAILDNHEQMLRYY